jgi:hypothetical protein
VLRSRSNDEPILREIASAYRRRDGPAVLGATRRCQDEFLRLVTFELGAGQPSEEQEARPTATPRRRNRAATRRRI